VAWIKAPQSLIDLFEEAVPDDPRVERRKMFGYPCFFVGGNLCAGVHQLSIFARLAASDRAALPGGGADFEPMPGRPMTGYTLIPDDVLADETALGETLAKAVGFTASLPPKEKKAKKRKG
jgi:hypothetical protein